MREIKLRAWDNKNGGWNSSISAKSESAPFVVNQITTLAIPENQHLDIQQFTGLKDKNGKEIYEGDIVRARNKYNFTPEKYPRYEIGFEAGSFIGRSIKRHTVAGKGLRWLTLRFDDEFEMVKIIGNIYEGPLGPA